MVRDREKQKLKVFGANLKRLREGKQLSLREMSYACDIDSSKIGKIEKGQINITFTTLLQLANALEIHPSELFNINLE